MTKGLYSKLALDGIKKNGKLYEAYKALAAGEEKVRFGDPDQANVFPVGGQPGVGQFALDQLSGRCPQKEVGAAPGGDDVSGRAVGLPLILQIRREVPLGDVELTDVARLGMDGGRQYRERVP